MQSYSILPTVARARELYLSSAVASFAAKKKRAKIVMYLTWGYRDGNEGQCPSGSGKCFPLGSNSQLTRPSCESSEEWHTKVKSFSCMTYSVARGYLSQLKVGGADIVAPCGIAWHVARNATPPLADCQRAVDAEYATATPFRAENNLTLPLRVDGLPASLSRLELYRKISGDVWDKHPNQAGQYLNALVFFVTLFDRSAVGAAGPLHTGAAPELPLKPATLLALQRVASSVVLDHSEHWRRSPSKTALTGLF